MSHFIFYMLFTIYCLFLVFLPKLHEDSHFHGQSSYFFQALLKNILISRAVPDLFENLQKQVSDNLHSSPSLLSKAIEHLMLVCYSSYS